MSRDKTTKTGAPKPRPTDREMRLKAALKANLGRRKAQTRARAATDAQDEQTDKKD